MPTLKEVAKRAGVSIGTVSNVINGKRVKEELRVAVEKAIRDLHYTPHAVARSLKNNKTHNIALILPTLLDSYLTELIKHSERFFRESGYSITLYITNYSPDEENKALENVRQHKFDGLVIYSCQEDGAARVRELTRSGILVVCLEKECCSPGEGVNFVASENRSSAQEAVRYFVALGHRRIALVTGETGVSDLTLMQGYVQGLAECSIELDRTLIRLVQPNRENAFKEMFALLQGESPPSAVILSNRAMAAGVFEAAHFNNINIPEDLLVVTLSEKSWLKHGGKLQAFIERPVEEIGRAVCNLLLENIRRPKVFEPKQRYVKSSFSWRGPSVKTAPPARKKRRSGAGGLAVKVLLLDSPAARAIGMLLPDFRREHGLEVNMHMLHFKELYNLSEKELAGKSPEYDVFMVDVSRIYALCETGSILDITGEISSDAGFARENFIEGLFESYCCYKDRIYSLPFMPGTQIMFYRKDLFSNRKLQEIYYRLYDSELRPPENWEEFNTTAAFFTRSVNTDSPTLFGTTMAARLPVFVANEFCPRKWAYGARAFDEQGRVAIISSEALNALRNFIQSYSYAPPWAFENDWDGEIDDFCSGACAMIIQYESHSTRISSRIKKELQGNIGYSMVPGGNPLLGGWSLAVNLFSKKKAGALDFVKWACSNKLAIPYSILGGTTAWKSYYQSADLNVLYPWLEVAYKSYRLARKRSSPSRTGPPIVRQGEYEEILGGEIKKALLGLITPEECLENAEAGLKKLVE